MARNPRYKKNNPNKSGTFIALVAIAMLVTVVSVKGTALYKQEKELKAREAQLEAQLEAEQARTLEIEEYQKYTQTRKYVEEVARDKLGLVYPGEIIFKDESKNK